MKTLNHTLLIAVAAIGFFFFGGTEAKAQDSISIQSTLKRTYYVEVQYHFLHWTSGGEQIYWHTVLETENYFEAQGQYKVTLAAMNSGALDSSGPTTITTAIDVRLRSKLQKPFYLQPQTSLSFQKW